MFDRFVHLGIYQPRKASDGAELKSGRVISNTFIKKPPSSFATDFTYVLMSWGQFITHDVTKAATFTSRQLSIACLSY